MGNQQSNERRRNYKIRKITNVDENTDYVRCFLDDYVTYSKHMDFEKLSTGSAFMRLGAGLLGGGDSIPERAILAEGWSIAIDIDWTRDFSRSRNFSAECVKTLGPRRSSLGDGGLQGNISEIGELREMLARANEWSDFDKQAQQAWQLQPPKK